VALAIDASSPALATAPTATTPETATTASFTPPASSLLVVLISSDSNSATVNPSYTVTDNLGVHLTYTQRVFAASTDTPAAGGGAAIYTAPVVTSAAMTVSVTTTSAGGGADTAAQVQVLTGGGTTPTVGANGKANITTSGTAVSCSYTGTGAGSWGFSAVSDWNATGTMTAGTGCTMIGTAGTFTGLISYGFPRRTSADGTVGGTITLAATLAAVSTAKHIAALEILDPGGAAAQIPTLVMARSI
jgi:hypothetical protein